MVWWCGAERWQVVCHTASGIVPHDPNVGGLLVLGGGHAADIPHRRHATVTSDTLSDGKGWRCHGFYSGPRRRLAALSFGDRDRAFAFWLSCFTFELLLTHTPSKLPRHCYYGHHAPPRRHHPLYHHDPGCFGKHLITLCTPSIQPIAPPFLALTPRDTATAVQAGDDHATAQV